METEADVPGKLLDFREVERPGVSNASPSLLVKCSPEEEIRERSKTHRGIRTLV